MTALRLSMSSRDGLLGRIQPLAGFQSWCYHMPPLLQAGAALNQPRTSDGCTALCIAAYAGHLEVVQMLLKAGADLNQAKTDGCTPLHLATTRGHEDVVQTLIAAGASQ